MWLLVQTGANLRKYNMLYVLYGEDTKKSRDKLNALIRNLLSKKKDANLSKLDNENFDPRDLLDHIKSQGLFEQKSIIVLDTLFSNVTDKGIVLDNIKDIGESDNVFIVIEGKLDAKTKNKLEKHAEKMQECALAKSSAKKKSFNIFDLADALGERDRKQLWVLFQTGMLHNISAEEMHGILFWGTKNMLLAKQSTSAKEANLSSFVYGKAKRYAENYSDIELQKLSGDLVSIYHQARRGAGPLGLQLEKLLLQR